MSSDEETTERTEVETETETETEEPTEEREAEGEATLDIGAAVEQEETVEQLRGQIDEQQERIEELENMVLDLSTRVADDRATGVCPDCHGPVVKQKPLFRSAKIKCMDCDRVFHEY